MRRINNTSLTVMTSPIKHVMATLHLAIVNIAPERSSEFDSTYNCFSLEYLNTPEWKCSVIPERRHILLSRRVVEVTWCASYAYVLFYIKEIQGKDFRSARKIDLHSNPEVHKAMQLLSWAYNNWLHDEDILWPETLPRPIDNANQGSSLWLADEFCKCSMAYMLHHELAHIRLKHNPAKHTIFEEREADYSAAEWIMHPSLRDDDPKFVKRAIGIAIALEVMTSYGIYTGEFGGTTHPPSYDRLIHTLRRFIHDDNHFVWVVVVATMKLHLDSAGTQTPDTEYKSCVDCAEDYANILANIELH